MHDPQILPATASVLPAIPALDPVAEPRPVHDEPATATARPRNKGITRYDQITESLAHVTTLVGAGILWWVGAQFTLAFMRLAYIPVDALSYAQWLIPAGITMIELKYWPRKGLNRNLLITFIIIAGIDLSTSVVGGQQWLAGRPIGSYTIPDTAVIWLVAFVVACFSAFWPEKLARAAITELRKIWHI